MIKGGKRRSQLTAHPLAFLVVPDLFRGPPKSQNARRALLSQAAFGKGYGARAIPVQP
jgi:hypothetical protein